MKRLAYVALVLALVIQFTWEISALKTIPHDMNFWFSWFVLGGFAMVALTKGRAVWASWLMRVGLGLDFTATTLDRYGIFGPYGTKGVNWGDFQHFIAYTHQVNAFLPASFAPLLAYAANVCEIVLAVALILGICTSLACLATALLLLAYACAMTISFGFTSQFPYAVFLLSAGAWYLANTDSSFLSVDRLFNWIARSAVSEASRTPNQF